MKIKIFWILLFITGFSLVWAMFEILSAFDLSLWWGLAVIGLMLIIALSKKIKTLASLTNIVGVSISLGLIVGISFAHPIVDAVSASTIHIWLPSSILSIDVVAVAVLVVALIFLYKRIKALAEYIALPFSIACYAVAVMLFGMALKGGWDWMSGFVH